MDSSQNFRHEGVVLKELRCNARRLGVRPGGGTQIHVNWTDESLRLHMTLSKPDSQTSCECTIDRGMIKMATHAGKTYNAVVLHLLPLSRELTKRNEWLHILGDARDGRTPFDLVLTVDLTGCRDDGQSAAQVWPDFIKWLKKFATCKQEPIEKITPLVFPVTQKVLEVKHVYLRTLPRSSLERLQNPKLWLDDEVMNVVIALLTSEHPSDSIVSVPTYGWPALDPGLAKDILRERFNKWHKRDIFKLCALQIPINVKNGHWMLAVVFYPGNVLRMAAAGPAQENDSTAVKQYGRYFRIIRDYLRCEAELVSGKKVTTWGTGVREGWILDKVLPAPQQQNGYDCGRYVLYFMYKILVGGDAVLDPGLTEQNIDQRWASQSIPEFKKHWRQKISDLSDAWLQNSLV
ncbi:hypothetical protein FRC07_006760 [Ceratobasidium sp. 392]|nr:hypothetical protein FRC07_006760 [Ceratobasidium sp. 392]